MSGSGASGEAPEVLIEAFAAFRLAAAELEAAYNALSKEAAGLRRSLSKTAGSPVAATPHGQLAERLAPLLEVLPGAVLVLDEAGVIRQINAAATALLGEPLSGETWTRVRTRAFRTRRPVDGDLELHDGRRISLGQRALGGNGGRVLLMTDVTESRRLEELLARHRRLAALGEMAASLAHQVRTPLSAALLYVSNACRPELPAEQRDALLGRAISCMHDLEGLINDMLGFARGSQGPAAQFTLAELLAGVESRARATMGEGQTLEVKCTAPSQVLSGQRESLTGALLNLVTNGLEAAGAGGHVSVIGDLHGPYAEIAVSDDGPGIARELADRVFEPFFTSRPDGTGLGLAVARSVTQAHRGELMLAEGGSSGATFLMRLPLPDTATGYGREVEAA
jgi:two-component system sensor histidine kinase FlrB